MRWQWVETVKTDGIVTVRDESWFTPLFSILRVDMLNMHLQISAAPLAQDYHLSESVATSVGDFEIWQRT